MKGKGDELFCWECIHRLGGKVGVLYSSPNYLFSKSVIDERRILPDGRYAASENSLSSKLFSRREQVDNNGRANNGV